MGENLPWLLLISLILIVLIGTFRKRGQTEPGAAWWLVVALVGIVAWLRLNQVITTPQVWVAYGTMVTVNYLITFGAAYFLYKDPATLGNTDHIQQKLRIHYIIPVYNEPRFISRCVASVIEAAEFVSEIADVVIVIVNDASTDLTTQVLQRFAGLPNVQVMNLSKNAGKKGAIAAGSYGGENWREGADLFLERFGRNPTRVDSNALKQCLREIGCDVPECDIYLHTDSDSIITREFIYWQILAFMSDTRLGAVSGHCDVYLDADEEPSWMTRMQVAWYYTQFRIRKASESVYGAVFCVSGPGAGFWAEAVFHLFPLWVDDVFGRRIYRGATDRMLTLLVLKDGWKVKYSERAKVFTVVPSTGNEARKQWTRWKQNFWRMLVPVWQFAWRTHPVVAFLTYSRLIVTVLAPFILAYHLVWLSMGGVTDSALYLVGIAMMGSLMGMAYAAKNPEGWSFALLRPLMSLMSAFWGSVLTLRALTLTLKGSFTWRDSAMGKERGRLLYRWFDPPFEMRFLEVILIITVILYLIRVF
ncbi:hypothetical protein A2368_03880 [Candidatus Collierbacteria bacterium RIFOXYB1_FULL_49_13]|uniref:Glycosyltransferase 2-like domain-containing protein n=1 Tax=Candidatus Collierbacteria bacterium RIFOXYB1_FULL_49_13 TaxID=1817728 RepID=A0A1F5FJG4_9BACT|nr:MAG: hypothetical protein A2368_03880 [Candidatus Collierbacteria bacterium RIFOXYB1_FULL_49_13]